MGTVNKIVLSAVTAAVNAVRDRLPSALASDRLKVDGSGVTQPVSDAGGSLTVDGAVTATQGTAAAANAPWYVRLSDGSSAISVALDATVQAVRDRLPSSFGAGGGVKVDGSGTPLPVSASALPLPTGAATETTLASVLAKIIAAPATEAKQDTGNTSLSTLAGIVAAGKAAISAAQLPAALGITTASGSLSVAPASDALFDVKDRAARLLGALTGVNGSSVATGANPVPMQLSDGSAVFTGAKDSTLTGGSMIAIAKGAAATGAAVSGNPVYVGGKDGSGNAQPVRVSAAGNVQVGQAKGTSYASSAAEISAVVSNTACSPAMINVRNVSGNTRYVHCFNATSVPGSGTVPVFMFMLTANSDAQKTFPIPTDRFGTGLTIVASSTAGTLTASVSSDFLIQVDLYPSST